MRPPRGATSGIILYSVLIAMLALAGWLVWSRNRAKPEATQTIVSPAVPASKIDERSEILSKFKELHRIVVLIHAETAKQSMEFEIEILKARNDPLAQNKLRWDRLQNELNEKDRLAPHREVFFSIEEEIKKANNGALPPWVKDDRSWQYLDKEWSRK